MSLRIALLASIVAIGISCGSPQSMETSPNEPKTAKDKQLREAKANGELDSSSSSKWAGWRYQGDRNDCFYVVGRHCFKTQPAACSAARCRAPKKCEASGGGPATVSCK